MRGGERERVCLCGALSKMECGVPRRSCGGGKGCRVLGFFYKNYVVSAEKNDAVSNITLTFVKQLTQTALSGLTGSVFFLLTFCKILVWPIFLIKFVLYHFIRYVF